MPKAKNANGVVLGNKVQCQLSQPGGGGRVPVTILSYLDRDENDDDGFIQGVLVEYADGERERVPTDELYN